MPGQPESFHHQVSRFLFLVLGNVLDLARVVMHAVHAVLHVVAHIHPHAILIAHYALMDAVLQDECGHAVGDLIWAIAAQVMQAALPVRIRMVVKAEQGMWHCLVRRAVAVVPWTCCHPRTNPATAGRTHAWAVMLQRQTCM